MAVAHYLEALAWQRDAARLHAIFGGKNPHPIFSWAGVASADRPQLRLRHQRQEARPGADVIAAMRTFVDQVYVPDTLAIAGFYKDWAERGEGLGNFLCYGDLPERASCDPASFLFPRGSDPQPATDLTIHAVDLHARQPDPGVRHPLLVRLHGWSPGRAPPYAAETSLNYDGRGGVKPPFTQLDVQDGYSWLKAPRWKGNPVEVGPWRACSPLRGHQGPRPSQAKELVGMTLKRSTYRCGASSPPWAAPPRARSRPRSSPTRCRAGMTIWSRTSSRRLPDLQRDPVGSLHLAPARPRAPATWRPRAEHSVTGS